jgi:hypothetical protein
MGNLFGFPFVPRSDQYRTEGSSLRLSAPRLAVSAAVIGTAAVTASVAFAAAGPNKVAPVAKAGAPTADRSTHVFNDASAASAVAYWTPERMRAAKPFPLRKTANATAVAGNSAQTTAEQVPADIPPAPVGGSTTSGDVSSSYVTAAQLWKNTGAGIARTTGRIFFSYGGNDYVCSGTVVNAPNRHTIWTAAHCLREAGPNGGWHRNVVFVPGYRGGKRPYGTYPAVHGAVTKQWVNSTNFDYQVSYDLAAFTVKAYGGKQIQSRTGAQGIAWGYSKRTYYMRLFGYPVVFLPSKKPTKDGYLYYCTGKTQGVRFHSQAPVSLAMACTMGGGASGGSWLYGMNDKGWGKVAGVNSTHSRTTKYMYSPYQGKAAADLYNYIKNK